MPIATALKPSFSRNDEIKAVVFDIYGTLIISASGDLDKSDVTTSGITKALNEAGFSWCNTNFEDDAKALLNLFHESVTESHTELKAKGHPYPEVDIIAIWHKVTTKAIENEWIQQEREPDLKVLTVVFELLSNAVYPMPNMNNVLEKLFNSKLPLGIVSNAQFYTPIIMNYFISDKVQTDEHVHGFDEDISVYSYKLLRSKPDTYLFKTLADSFETNYKLKPNQVLFVGNDMLKDIWTANEIGFKTALFAADERSLRLREDDDRTASLKADYIINDLNQLFDIVNIK